MRLVKKSDNYIELERKALWRLIKVLYVFASIVITLTVWSGAANLVEECYNSNDPNYVQSNSGSRLARERLLKDLSEGRQVCNISNAQTDAWIQTLLTPIALIAIYLVLKRLMNYILVGSKANKTNVV